MGGKGLPPYIPTERTDEEAERERKIWEKGVKSWLIKFPLLKLIAVTGEPQQKFTSSVLKRMSDVLKIIANINNFKKHHFIRLVEISAMGAVKNWARFNAYAINILYNK